jgi:hypothetical protein
VIHLLNSYFVPVYTSYEAHDTGDAPAGDKKEWRRIYHEANTKLRRSGTVHVYILHPANGQVIESIDIGTATQPEKLLARLSAVVERLKTPAGKPVVAPAPQSHPPAHAADDLVLHLAARSYKGTWNEFPVEDWIVLSPAEAARLLPPGEVAVASSWEMDKTVAARFLTKFLPNGFGYAGYHKTRVAELALKATVVSVDQGIARARITGAMKLTHQTLNFQVSPPAPIEQIAVVPLTGFIDFAPGEHRVRALRLLSDRATARQGEVEYAVALRSMP